MGRLGRISVVLLVSAVLMSQARVGESMLKVFRIHIANGLSNNNILDLHCKSKDDDLGLHHLAVHHELVWQFRVNFWDTTLYFCNARWVGGHCTFDAFKMDPKLVENFCDDKECRWLAKDDGIYAYSVRHYEYRIWYKWEH